MPAQLCSACPVRSCPPQSSCLAWHCISNCTPICCIDGELHTCLARPARHRLPNSERLPQTNSLHSCLLQIVEELASNVGVIERLQSFQYKDAKDWGLNVRQRAKELCSLVTDPDRIRQERSKVGSCCHHLGTRTSCQTVCWQHIAAHQKQSS